MKEMLRNLAVQYREPVREEVIVTMDAESGSLHGFEKPRLRFGILIFNYFFGHKALVPGVQCCPEI